jgi:hypothetical protein
MNMNPRPLTARLISLGVIFTCMFALYTYSSNVTFHLPGLGIFPQRPHSSCTPHAWNSGEWVYEPHTNRTAMTKKEDALEFAGLEGCASDREFFWHLASDVEEQWIRWPKVSSYVWKPTDRCGVRPLDGPAMVKDMVEQGGWLLLGGMSGNIFIDDLTQDHAQTRSPKATSSLFLASYIHMCVRPRIILRIPTSIGRGRKIYT